MRRTDAAATPSSAPGVSMADQLAGVDTASSLAVVDDTIFSGITLRKLLEALPASVRARTHAFCLRCVAESLPPLQMLCPITPGFAASGRLLDEVSFINASGLVRRGAIRRTGLAPLAFFERPEWMDAWFPGYAADVIDCCRRLNRLLEPDGSPSLPAAVSLVGVGGDADGLGPTWGHWNHEAGDRIEPALAGLPSGWGRAV